MLFALTPTAAFAETYTDGTVSFEYSVSDEKVAITKYTGTATEVTIPGEIDGKPVTTIGSAAFSQNANITAVTIPASVTTIMGGYRSGGAFDRCYNLERVILEKNSKLETIGNCVFDQCSKLSEINLEDAEELTSIGMWAFENTALDTLVLPANVESIGSSAFCGSGLTSVQLQTGSRLKDMDACVFQECASLKTVDLSNAMQLEWIPDNTFYKCGNLASVTLPGNGCLTKIGPVAFAQTALKSIAIPATVTEIAANAFASCASLERVTFEETSALETIGYGAFDCTALTSVTIPASVKAIDSFEEGGTAVGAFSNCNQLTTVTFAPGSQLETLGKDTFAGTDLTKIICYNEKMKAVLKEAGVLDDSVEVKIAKLKITVEGNNGTAWVNGEQVTEATEGDEVTIKAADFSDSNMKFDHWKVNKGNVTLTNDHAAETTFTMPAEDVELEVMLATADTDDSSWDTATVVTGVVLGTGTAVLAYHIGMEVYAEQVLGKGVAVPKTRAEVALLAWQLAGKPEVAVEGEPLSEAAMAQKWAVESGLMQNDADGSFNPDKKMSKWKALRTLDAAKKR